MRCISICFALVVMSFLSDVAAARAETAWYLQQINTQAGKQLSWIAPNAIKLRTKTITMVMKAPKYDAIIYNDTNKRYVMLPYQTWQNRYKRDPKLAVPECLKTGKTEDVAGFKCDVYKRVLFHQHGAYEELWISRELSRNPKFSDLVLTALRMPTGLGMPMRVNRLKNKQIVDTTVDTLKASKVKVSDADFAVPKGYKRVTNEIEVLLGGSDEENPADLLMH